MGSKIFILLLTFAVVALVKGKPTSNYCKTCNNLVSFSKLLSNELSKSGEVKDNLVDWCKNVTDGSTTESCLFIIDNLQKVYKQVDSNHFCSSIGACHSSNYYHIETDASNDSVSCQFCLNSVTHLKEIVASPPTKNELKLLLSSLCKPLKSLHLECVKLLDENLDEIFTYLRNHVNPRSLCEASGCCPKSKTQIVVADTKKLSQFSDYIGFLPANFEPGAVSDISEVSSLKNDCEMCKMLFEIIYQELKQNRTEEAIEESLEKVCNFIYKDETKINKCHQLITRETDAIIQMIIHNIQPSLACSLMGFCSKSEIKIAVQRSDNQLINLKGPQCPLCKLMVKEIYKLIGDNRTESAIISSLDLVCESIAYKNSKKCENMVKMYTDKLVEIIMKTESPELVCSLLFLCGEPEQLETKDVLEVPVKSVAIISPECSICQKLMKLLYQYLKENSTEEEAKETLDKICFLFPKADQEQCADLINEYYDEILSMLVQSVSSNEACLLLKFCDKSVDVSSIADDEREQLSPVGETEVENTDIPGFCDICRTLLFKINNQVVNFNESLFDTIEKSCMSHKQKERQDKCIKFLDKYADMLTTLLKKSTNPDVVCEKLHVCVFFSDNEREVLEDEYTNSNGIRDDSEQDMMTEKDQESTREHEFCYECQLITHFIQEELYDYKSEQAITEFINHHICTRLAPIIKSDLCIKFIDQYGDALIQAIARQIFDPKLICDRELKVCPNSLALEPSKTEFEISLLTPEKEATCQLCLDVVTKLDRILEYDDLKNLTAITSDTVCDGFEDTNQEACFAMFSGFGNHLIHLVGYLDGANKICKAVDLCIGPGYSRLLGGQKCTFGPTYWCHTTLHAQACKATDYCKTKVWKPIESLK